MFNVIMFNEHEWYYNELAVSNRCNVLIEEERNNDFKH